MLRLATSMEASGGELNALLMGSLILVFVGIGTAIAAGGTASVSYTHLTLPTNLCV